MEFSIEKLGEKQSVSRKDAALQQIHIAIRLLGEREFASAITLALAAEGQMPRCENPHVLSLIENKVPNKRAIISRLNYVRDWLKHDKPEDQIDIFEFEVFIALARATSKYNSVYQSSSVEMEGFILWARRKGFTKEWK